MKIIISLILLSLTAVPIFLVGAGEEGKEIARVGKRNFVCFAWFSLLFLVTLFCNREWFNTMTGILGFAYFGSKHPSPKELG